MTSILRRDQPNNLYMDLRLSFLFALILRSAFALDYLPASQPGETPVDQLIFDSYLGNLESEILGTPPAKAQSPDLDTEDDWNDPLSKQQLDDLFPKSDKLFREALIDKQELDSKKKTRSNLIREDKAWIALDRERERLQDEIAMETVDRGRRRKLWRELWKVRRELRPEAYRKKSRKNP